MSKENSSRTQAAPFTPSSMAVTVLVLIGLAVTWYQTGRTTRQAAPGSNDVTAEVAETSTDSHSKNTPPTSNSVPAEDEPTLPEFAPEHRDSDGTVSTPVSNSGQAEDREKKPFQIPNQTIRDQNGNVVFKGTIDLTPTLDRIERGEGNRHRNDGTTFQNREARLPRKPGGYYKEYVHLTPDEKGPGPQRVILGRDGDIWYTPDHYKTFKQIKSAPRAADEAN